jgi:hypothetical protein
VPMLHANARVDQFMRQDAGDPRAVGDHRRDEDLIMIIAGARV